MNQLAYLEFDVRKKDITWCNRVLTDFRNSTYKRILDLNKAADNRGIISSSDSIEFIKQMFKNPEQMEAQGYKFVNIAVMERFKNIIIAEGLQQEIKAYVDAQDPSLIRLKQEDKNLLINKSLVEEAANSLKESVGLPKTKITNDDFNGNYSDFESFAFDPNNPMDVNTFYDIFYQLDVESDFQKIIDHTFQVNNVIDLVPEFREDIMATKMMAYQTFVNKVTGQINIRRIQPEKIFRIKGKENPRSQEHDIAVGYYDVITVSEFLKRVGDVFDLVRNISFVANGIASYNQGIVISGIEMPDGTTISVGDSGTVIGYSSFLNYQIQVGYIEFKTIDAKNYKVNKNYAQNSRVIPLGAGEEKAQLAQEGYETIQKSYERTYYANFIDTGSNTQFVVNFGRVYLQETLGIEDEYSAFTLKYHLFGGKTFAEIAKPWLDIANEAFHKFKYLLRKAKEDGVDYNLDSLAEVSQRMLGGDGKPLSIKEAWNLFEDSVNSVYALPKNAEGLAMPMQGDMNRQIIRDFDSKFKSFTDIITWTVEQIKSQTGINDLRSGDSPTTNDVYKLEKAALESANNVTFYMNYMFDSMFRKNGTSIISHSMDLIRFKQSLGCKYIQQVIGEEGLKRLQKLPKISPHRMDIFVSSFANYKDRSMVFQDTMIALQNKLISYTDKVLIDSVNDFRKARKLLVNREQAAKVEAQQQIQDARYHEIEMEKLKADIELRKIDRKGGWEVKKTQAQAQGFKEAAQANQEGGITKQQLKSEDERSKLNLEHQLEQQQAFGIPNAASEGEQPTT